MVNDTNKNWESWIIRLNGTKEEREIIVNKLNKVLENSKLEDFVMEEE